MKEGIIPEAFISFYIDGLKDLQDFFMVEESDEGLLSPFLWDVEYCICMVTMFRIEETNHFSKGLENRQTVIPCLGQVFAFTLNLFEECYN